MFCMFVAFALLVKQCMNILQPAIVSPKPVIALYPEVCFALVFVVKINTKSPIWDIMIYYITIFRSKMT